MKPSTFYSTKQSSQKDSCENYQTKQIKVHDRNAGKKNDEYFHDLRCKPYLSSHGKTVNEFVFVTPLRIKLLAMAINL